MLKINMTNFRSRSRQFALFLLLLSPLLGSAGQPTHYEFTVIAQTGVDGFTGFEPACSINDSGQVAFIGQTNNSTTAFESVFRGDGSGAPVNLSPGFAASSRDFAPFLQINNAGDVVARDRVSGAPATFLIRKWNGSFVTIARSAIAPTLYDSVTLPSLNNAGQVSFVALESGSTITSLKLNAGATDVNIASYAGSFSPRPMLDDTGASVFRDATGRIVKWDATGTTVEIIAATNHFSSLGQSPGVSDDGQIVTFAGTLTAAGALALSAAQPNFASLDPGAGIFASVAVTGSARVTVRLAGLAGNAVLDPGEGFLDSNQNGRFDAGDVDVGFFSAFGTDARVGVNATQATGRSCAVVFNATSTNGVAGLYSLRFNFFGAGTAAFNALQPAGFTVSDPSVVAEVGSTLTNLPGTVTVLSTFDPVNNRDRGDVAFHALLSSGAQAIVRASPVEVVYLDFDPVHHFTLGPSADALLQSINAPPSWFGSLATVFAALAPSRADLPAATIQDNVVAGVQAAFDDVDPAAGGAQRVRVKVLGKVGEVPPEDGPFVRVFIGDSPTPASGFNQLAGMSPIDLYNQGTDDNSASRGSVFQKTPLIFADNLFRTSSGFFTTQTGGSSTAVSLNDSGPARITPTQVENALIKAIAHEVGHAFGLMHLNRALNTEIMNAQPSSPLVDGLPDELRALQIFSNFPQAVDSGVTQLTGISYQENSAARLAFAAGSATPVPQLLREPPHPSVQGFLQRANFLMGSSLSVGALAVQRAVLGLVPLGQADALPRLVDLGSGDLATLLNRPITAAPADQVFLVATTTGTTADVFSFTPGSTNGLGAVTLTNGLDVLTNPDLRGGLAVGGQPEFAACDLYRLVGNTPVRLGVIGDPTAPPRLGLRLTSGGLLLSWPQEATGFVLEGTASLSSPAWSTNGLSATVTNGQRTLVVPPTGSAQYFRLRHP